MFSTSEKNETSLPKASDKLLLICHETLIEILSKIIQLIQFFIFIFAMFKNYDSTKKSNQNKKIWTLINWWEIISIHYKNYPLNTLPKLNDLHNII